MLSGVLNRLARDLPVKLETAHPYRHDIGPSRTRDPPSARLKIVGVEVELYRSKSRSPRLGTVGRLVEDESDPSSTRLSRVRPV